MLIFCRCNYRYTNCSKNMHTLLWIARLTGLHQMTTWSCLKGFTRWHDHNIQIHMQNLEWIRFAPRLWFIETWIERAENIIVLRLTTKREKKKKKKFRKSSKKALHKKRDIHLTIGMIAKICHFLERYTKSVTCPVEIVILSASVVIAPSDLSKHGCLEWSREI